jgi:hypothetical protein
VIAALAIAGCGDSSSKPTGTTPAGGADSASGSGAPKPETKAARRPHSRARGTRGGRTTSSGTAGKAAGKKPPSIPPSARRDITVRAATAILGQLGLPVTSVAVTRNADAITIAIPKSAACTATSADEPRAKLILGKLLPLVKKINLTVAGSGQSLGAYVAAHCGAGGVPPGPGRVLFHKSGAGFVTTQALKVTASRWTVAYESQASLLQISVYPKGSRHALGTVAVQGRRKGKKTFSGPGTFVLKTASPAIWTIEVRDGG